MNSTKKTTSEAFVSYVMQKISWDKDFCRKLKLADTQQFHYFSDELLSSWFFSEDNSHKAIFSTIAASMIRTNTKTMGAMAFAKAFSKIDNKKHYTQSQLKILLQSSDVIQCCSVIRKMLREIESHKFRINYIKLLDQLLFFDSYPERQKIIWAKDYYRTELN